MKTSIATSLSLMFQVGIGSHVKGHRLPIASNMIIILAKGGVAIRTTTACAVVVKLTGCADWGMFSAVVAGRCDLRYNGYMIRAYDEIVDFIAAGTTPATVAGFEPSQRTKDYVEQLIHKEKTIGLTEEETSELDHFMQLEHIMRLAKARARSLCSE